MTPREHGGVDRLAGLNGISQGLRLRRLAPTAQGEPALSALGPLCCAPRTGGDAALRGRTRIGVDPAVGERRLQVRVLLPCR